LIVCIGVAIASSVVSISFLLAGVIEYKDDEAGNNFKNSRNALEIYINADNTFLQSFLRQKEYDDVQSKLIKEKFRIATGILGLSLFNHLKKNGEENYQYKVEEMSRGFGQVILPLISNLNSLVDEQDSS